MYALKEVIQYTFSTGCDSDVATELYHGTLCNKKEAAISFLIIYMSSDSIVRFLDELSENLDMIYSKIEQNIHDNFPLMVIDNDEY